MLADSRITKAIVAVGLCASMGLGRRETLAGGGSPQLLNCDTNGDGVRDIGDPIYQLTWLFLGGPEPVPFDCPGDPPAIQNGDCNGDGVRDVSDAVLLLLGLFVDPTQAIVEVECPEISKPTLFAGSLTRTRGRWTFGGQVGPAGANAICAENWPGSRICTITELRAAASAGELAGAVDLAGLAVMSFWAIDEAAAPERQCLNSAAEKVPWTYATGHLGVSGEFVALDGATGALGDIRLDNRCRDSHWVACCNPPSP